MTTYKYTNQGEKTHVFFSAIGFFFFFPITLIEKDIVGNHKNKLLYLKLKI